MNLSLVGALGLAFGLGASFPSVALGQEPMPTVDELTKYEPTPAYPFGRRHPDAPEELEQFAFMIGEFDCVDEIRNTDGTTTRTEAIWNASWFLNGHAIQDQYWSDTFATTNLRFFDADLGRWRVHFARMPSPSVSPGVWLGDEVIESGEKRMVMWAGTPDRRNGSRLTFYDIRDDGFEWHAESLRDGVATIGWTSSCKRRGPGSVLRQPKFHGADPSPARPFGRRHEDAPAQLAQASFLLGSFDASEIGVPHRRSAAWCLNGWGIQERRYEPGIFSARFWLWDGAAQAWRVQEFQAPQYRWRLWHGSLEERSILLREHSVPDPFRPPEQARALWSEERLAPLGDGAYEFARWLLREEERVPLFRIVARPAH